MGKCGTEWKNSMEEGESATYTDITEEFYNSAIFTTKITTK